MSHSGEEQQLTMPLQHTGLPLTLRKRQRGITRSGLPSKTVTSAHAAQSPVWSLLAPGVPASLLILCAVNQDKAVTPIQRRGIYVLSFVAAEAAHYAKTEGKTSSSANSDTCLHLDKANSSNLCPQDEDEDPEAKRRRILEETRDIDADSDW